MAKTYSEKLRDPRWQKKRLEIFNRDNWTCTECSDSKTELQVHHKSYTWGKDPWDYDNSNLKTLCSKCHHKTHFIDVPAQHEQKTIETLPFDVNEGHLIKNILLYSTTKIEPKWQDGVSKNYKTLIEFVFGEFLRYSINFTTPEFQSVYDSIAFKYYNDPNFKPDPDDFLTSQNPIVSKYSRFLIESESKLSPYWAKLGISVEPKESDIIRGTLNIVFEKVLSRFNAIRRQKQDQLKSGSVEEIQIISELNELNKIIGIVNNDKLYW